MKLYSIEVRQVINQAGVQVQNEYHFYAENGMYLGVVIFPPNGQLMYDAKMLEVITKSIAIRWGFIEPPRRRK